MQLIRQKKLMKIQQPGKFLQDTAYPLSILLVLKADTEVSEKSVLVLAMVVMKAKQGWDVEAIGVFSIAIIDLFAKAGLMFSSTDASSGGKSSEETSEDFLWGVGAGAHFGPFGARLEWESIVVEGPTSISMVSLSATFGF